MQVVDGALFWNFGSTHWTPAAGYTYWAHAQGLVLADYGQRTVPMKLCDGRKIWITFQVCDVSIPVMSVGKFCAKGDDRRATFTKNGGILWHEEAKEIEIDRVRNHYELDCWIKPARVSRVVSPSESTGKPERHHVEVPQRADYENPMCTQGADVPRVSQVR